MRIAITGTSGVGKTFLETLLSDKYGFIQIPKYTNRPKRPSEIEGKGIFFRSKEDLIQYKNDYFFMLEYMGYLYKWKKEDLDRYQNNNVSIGITLESMTRIVDSKLDFIPILLYIDPSNIKFLEKRIKKQLDYNNLNTNKKIEADKIIAQRLDAVIIESQNIDKYIDIISKSKSGKAFMIQNDSTIGSEVIPYILSL